MSKIKILENKCSNLEEEKEELYRKLNEMSLNLE